ncbi:MAG TPA: ABC transporter permease [Candidatus Sulfotelmatobacter sp.]|nr:ABC transporter permease [Candidatus Sulfotelmatobacter sp.]
MELLLQDLRYSVRQIRKSPGFAAIAILTVALGIGSNAAIFSFVDALYLKSLPVSHPEQLVHIYAKGPSGHYGAGFSYPEFEQLRDHHGSFSSLAVETQVAQLHLVSGGDSQEIRGEFVSGNYFSLLGVQPALGRSFLPEEDTVRNRDAVAVISDRLWKAHFNQYAVLGREIQINGVALKVIGVAPPEFYGDFTGRPVEVWIPAMMYGSIGSGCDNGSYNCSLFDTMLGRLAADQTPMQAQAEISSEMVWSASDWPDRPSRRQAVLAAASGESPYDQANHVGQMQMLMSVTASLLLIACANLAGLLLARGVTRRREISIRLAIGAGRARVIRQLLTESLFLSCLGGAGGLVVSVVAKQLLSGFYSADSEGFHHLYDVSFDWRVLLYSIALTLVTGALFGLLPAIRASRQDLVTELKDGGSASPQTKGWLRQALVIGQLALSMVLVICSGLLVRSALQVRRGTNFDPEHTVVLRLRPELLKYTQTQTESLLRRVDQQLRGMAGIESVAFMEGGEGLVWDWESGRNAYVSLSAQPQDRRIGLEVHKQDVSQHFFRTLRVPLLQGREISEQDRPGSRLVAVVNQTLAQRLWPDQSAVGQTLFINAQPFQVVGVAANVQPRNSTHSTEPHLYLSYWQSNATLEGDIRFAVRVAGDLAPALREIRRAVQSIDPVVPVGEDMSLSEQVGLQYMPVVLAQNVMLFCGVLALCLSAMGLYSIVAFAVRTRTREFGIRMALGARRKDVLRLVVTQGTKLALVGVAIGAIAALLSTRLLASLLFGVRATDPVTYFCATILLFIAGLTACYLPARKATSVDPVQALHSE